MVRSSTSKQFSIHAGSSKTGKIKSSKNKTKLKKPREKKTATQRVIDSLDEYYQTVRRPIKLADFMLELKMDEAEEDDENSLPREFCSVFARYLPDQFRPERFLEEDSKVEANGNDFLFIPFGVGRHSFPGIILALPILGITLGRLVQNFELLPPPGMEKLDTYEKGGQFSLHILKHYTVVAKPREF
ncbi:Trans-cinnamate 4-monooxygenase [Dendrobium catenatum]|uniref:Trans-cinnamate 4-monooxygenase n=1 Tax=Dendrobium catenatum TaxID=906689 RepID=A0A2I0W7A2_9ASPA|nr:Trans-cinnamate 4-monooxygenase [Dendrobium catenatum]